MIHKKFPSIQYHQVVQILKAHQAFKMWRSKPKVALQSSCGSGFLDLCQAAMIAFLLLPIPSNMALPTRILDRWIRKHYYNIHKCI